MGKQFTVNPSYTAVRYSLNNPKNYKGGDTVILSDAEYSALTTALTRTVNLASVTTVTDPIYPTYPFPNGTPISNTTGVYNVKDYGAKGDDSTDDYNAITAAIAATPPGGVVYFPPGKYIVTNTILIPANITLRGTLAWRWPQYGGTPVYIKPKFGSFLGTSLLSAVENDDWRIEHLSLQSGRAVQSGTGNPVDGIFVSGAVKAVRLSNVMINNFSGYGVHTDSTSNGWAGGWEVSNLNVMNCALDGWRSDNTAVQSFAFSDSVIRDSECGANSGSGWQWSGAAAVDFVGLRSTWNTGGYGFAIIGATSNVSFTECQTDRNKKDGWFLNSTESNTANAPAPHVIMLNGCTASRDGKNANGGQGGYAGVRVVGTSTATTHVPVVINGFQSHVSKDDDGSGQLSPDYGVFATFGKSVIVNASVLHATVATISDDNAAVVDVGNNVHSTVNFSTGVVTALGTIGGIPSARPSDSGYKAWNYDPILATGSTAPTGGVLYLQRIDVRSTITVSKLVCEVVSTAGMALTSGQNFVGLYNSSGTVVGTTADITGSVATGENAYAITPVTITPGLYWVGILMNGTTLPTLGRASGQISGQGQSQIASSVARFGQFGTTQTALPTVTPGSITKTQTNSYFVALA